MALTCDFRASILSAAGAELRPPHAHLTVREVARRLRCGPQWVRKHYVPVWQARGFPRVTTSRREEPTGKRLRGRPYYAVARDDFERWMRPYSLPVLEA